MTSCDLHEKNMFDSGKLKYNHFSTTHDALMIVVVPLLQGNSSTFSLINMPQIPQGAVTRTSFN